MDEVPRLLKWTDHNKILEWETLSSRNTYSYIQLITKQYFLFKSSPLLCECVGGFLNIFFMLLTVSFITQKVLSLV